VAGIALDVYTKLAHMQGLPFPPTAAAQALVAETLADMGGDTTATIDFLQIGSELSMASASAAVVPGPEPEPEPEPEPGSGPELGSGTEPGPGPEELWRQQHPVVAAGTATSTPTSSERASAEHRWVAGEGSSGACLRSTS
jgi:hypothetical protein